MARRARISYDEALKLLGHASKLLRRRPDQAKTLLRQVATDIRCPPRRYYSLATKAGLEPHRITQ